MKKHKPFPLISFFIVNVHMEKTERMEENRIDILEHIRM
ncbi:MAG: hypothetical protein A4E23_00924 [Methanomethylovorans sp. PtaU1.Bin073]|nr:MAG: hypothetical protein A4E23_00924 [Methanomethylovorans sp. PtaU1.Bin073]